ncbi:MAG: hypothetical protein HC905_26130 [Bacteroidales bacterium]|nr:hypothetical protein [Bacteroidales bacterium]
MDFIASDDELGWQEIGIIAANELAYDNNLDYKGGLIVVEFLDNKTGEMFYRSIPVNSRELKDIEAIKYKLENWQTFLTVKSKTTQHILTDYNLKSIYLRLYQDNGIFNEIKH